MNIWIYRLAHNAIITQNPSLRPNVPQAISDAYADAVDLAWTETGLDDEAFPDICPYTPTQILDDAFFPEDAP